MKLIIYNKTNLPQIGKKREKAKQNKTKKSRTYQIKIIKTMHLCQGLSMCYR